MSLSLIACFQLFTGTTSGSAKSIQIGLQPAWLFAFLFVMVADASGATDPLARSADTSAISEYLEGEPHPDRGLYAIWYKRDAGVMDLPFVKGGQIVLQWRALEPKEGRYDFGPLDKQLRRMSKLGKRVTVQVNGNRKPRWLFKKVPYYPEKLSPQIADDSGSLMYWHPNHQAAYLRFLEAYADHLRQSPYRSVVVGVRMNFNSFGTEHLRVPPAARALGGWRVPAGVDPGSPFTKAAQHDYMGKVLEAFVRHLSDDFMVFVRAMLPKRILAPYMDLVSTGKLGLFYTSGEAEPRMKGMEPQYRMVMNHARGGETVAYAESWADSFGRRGGGTDRRRISAPQWNYWRLLFDLHCGVSFVAIYGDDLSVANGSSKKANVPAGYRREFSDAFDFAARYAGYHASPRRSPGAWIAFRHSPENRNYSKKLVDFTSDYTFLMGRLEDKSFGLNATNVGPDDQRFGAWARLLPAGEAINLVLDEGFGRSLEKKSATLRVTYLDSETAEFEASFGGQVFSGQATGSGQWKTVEYAVEAFDLVANDDGAHIRLQASKPVYFHMIEVVRGG